MSTSALEREDLRRGLGPRVVRGLVLTVGGQWGRLALQLLSTAVLARLLGPAEFGLVAMVIAVTGFAEQIKDLGLAAATVQRRELEERQVTALFWINVAVGVVLCVVVAAAAPLVAAFYGRPELSGITALLALGFLAGGLSVQHQALLQRRLRFAALASTEVGSFATGVAVGIGSALLGAGYWSLAAMHLATSVARAVALWSLCRWRPQRPSRHGGVAEMLSFGGGVSAFNLLNYISRNADNVLIGKVSGPEALGVYSRAYSLLLLPLQQLNAPLAAVSVPVLSLLKDEPQRYREYYRSAVGGLALFGFPLVTLLLVCAPEVVRLLLGPGWDEAVPIFRALGAAGLLQVIGNTNGWVYVSWGQTGRMARWALFSRPVIVLSFVAGLPWGPVGVATAYAVCQALLVVPGFLNALRGTPLGLGDIVAAIWRPVLLGLATAGVAMGLQAAVDGPPLLVIGVVGSCSLLVHSGLAWCWPAVRTSVSKIVQQRRRR